MVTKKNNLGREKVLPKTTAKEPTLEYFHGDETLFGTERAQRERKRPQRRHRDNAKDLREREHRDNNAQDLTESMETTRKTLDI